MLQPIAVKKKSYLIFAGEDFLLRLLLYKKKLSLKSERKGEKKKGKGASQIKRTSV